MNFDDIPPFAWLHWSSSISITVWYCSMLTPFVCVSGGVDTAAGGEEEDQEGLPTRPAPFPDKPRPQQPGPEQHIL